MATRRRGKKAALLTGAVLLALTALAALWYRDALLSRLLFWMRFESLGENDQSFPRFRHRETGIVFVRLPGGEFLMGAQRKALEAPNYDPNALGGDEGPVHEVTLSPFLMAETEVTREQWTGVQEEGEDKPVASVSWEECREFCRKRGMQLPTEAQWEYGCRAGVSGPYGGTGILDDMGWCAPGSTGHQRVRQKRPNAFGLYDMHGNVQEWCEDVYDPEFYSKPGASGPDPVATSGSEKRVLRGGSWQRRAGECRSSERGSSVPSLRYSDIGFRPVVPAP